MGAWGAGILQDDSAMDIIGDYRILLGYKIPREEAYKLIKDYYYPDFKGADDEDIFWFALAIYQLRNGILEDEVKKNAFKFLENPPSMDVWKNSGENIYKNRLKVLSKLKEELLNPSVTKPKKIPKPPKYYSFKSEFKEGDLILVEIQSDWLEEKSINYIGKYCLLRVVYVEKTPITKLKPELGYNSVSSFALYKWIGKEKPDVCDLSDIELSEDFYTFSIVGEDEQTDRCFSVIGHDINYKGKEKFGYPSSVLGSTSGIMAEIYFTFEKLRAEGEKFKALGD